MGLDVYLYRCKNLEAAEEYNERQSEAHSKIYDSVRESLGLRGEDRMPQEIYNERVHKAQETWDAENPAPADAEEVQVEIDSPTYPKHYFKIGYLRSSYNDGGINSVLSASIGKDLGTVFGYDGEYKFRPDWKASLERAREIKAEYQAFLDKHGALKAMEVGPNPFIGPGELPKDKKGVLEAFLRTQEQQKLFERPSDVKDKANWFSNRDGHYFLNVPIKVLGAISGVDWSGRPTTFLVYRDEALDSEDSNGKNWYLAALDITIETIEYVLAQPDQADYLFHWSS